MRFLRLRRECGDGGPALTFHPRLTVVTGLDRDGRQLLAARLIGTLAGTARDSRLDVLDDAGRHLSVRRAATPEGDRVLDLDTAHDVTLEFVNGGDVDLLHRLGLDAERADRRCRVRAEDLTPRDGQGAVLAGLASRDQAELWGAADRLAAAEAALDDQRAAWGAPGDQRAAWAAPGEIPGDAEAGPCEVESSHAELESVRARWRRSRRRCLLAGAPGLVAAAVAAALRSPPAVTAGAGGLLAVALLVALVRRLQVARAAAEERRQLAATGQSSYVEFRVRRIEERLDGRVVPPAVRRAAAERDGARVAWLAVGGGVSLETALALREQVAAAATRLADEGRLAAPAPDAGTGQGSPAELAEALVLRLADLRRVGPDAVSVPVILDEPLVGSDLATRQWMCELLAVVAGSPQVVYLTGDADIAAWARVESLTGQLEVVPGVAVLPEPTEPADGAVRPVPTERAVPAAESGEEAASRAA